MFIKQKVNDHQLSLTISLPTINLASELEKVGKSAGSILTQLVSTIREAFKKLPPFKFSLPNFASRFWPPRKPVVIIALVIFVLGTILVAKNTLFAGSNNADKITVKGARFTQTLNREFAFPIKDDKGQELTKTKFLLETVEIRDELIVKGQRASSVGGRTFLVLTIKVTNEYDKAIEINVRDFVRLAVGGNDKDWLAADIHNDPVNVRGQSTKITRIAYAVNETDKKFNLRVGELNGEKQTIELNLGK